MKDFSVLFILPVIITSTLLNIQAHPVSDGHTSVNGNDCIQMTDEKVIEIKSIVRELTDFIEALAIKHKNFDLRLVKLDIDNHDEFETDDKSTVLEVFVNDCAKRSEGNKVSEDLTEDSNQSDMNDSRTRQSYDEDVEATESFKTKSRRRASNTSQDATGSDINVNNLRANTNKKVIGKSKYQIFTKKKGDITASDVNNNSNWTSVNSVDESITEINQKKESAKNVETFSDNYEKTLSVANDNSIKNYSNKISPDSYNVKLNKNVSVKKSQSAKNYDNNNNYDEILADYADAECDYETSTENILNKIVTKSIENDKYQLNRRYKNNYAFGDNISVNGINVENNKKSLVSKEHQSTRNSEDEYNYIDKASSDNTYTKNTKQSRNKNSAVSNNESFINYSNKLATDETTHAENKNKSSMNTKVTGNNKNIPFNAKHDDNKVSNSSTQENNEHKQPTFNHFESHFLQSLKQMIRNEVKSINRNVDNSETRRKNSVVQKWQPEFMILDLPDDSQIKNNLGQKSHTNTPILVYLEEDRGQQRIQIL